MATTEASAESLGKALSYDDQEEKIRKLEALNEEARQREDDLRKEFEQIKGDLGKSQERLEEYEYAKQESRSMLQELSISDAHSMDLVLSLRVELLDKKREISDLQGKVDGLTLEKLRLQLESEKMGGAVIMLKSQVQDLDARVQSGQGNESRLRHDLSVARSEIITQQDEKRLLLKKSIDEKEALEREHKKLANEKELLAKKHDNCRTELEEMSRKATACEEKYEKLQTNHMRAEMEFSKLVSEYERHQKDLEAKSNLLGVELLKVEERSRQELESTTSELTQYRKRLDIADRYIEKLTGTNRSSADSTPVHETATVSSNLLKMMRQYENSGKRWEDIYGDYADLYDENMKLKTENTTLKSRYDKDNRLISDKQQLYDRMDNELQILRKKCKALELSLREHELTKEEYTEKVKALSAEGEDLGRKNKELTDSLNDTTYQLRYLIREAKSNGTPLPPNVQSSEQLLENAHITPTFEHSTLVFKNADELQQKNQELLNQLRELNAKVLQQAGEIGRLSELNRSALDTSNSIEALQKENDDLRRRIESHSEESALNMKFWNLQQGGAAGGQEPNNVDLNNHIREFEEATKHDILKLQEELKEERASVKKTSRDLREATEEAILLKQRCKFLEGAEEKHVFEINDLRQKKEELEGKLVAREDLLTKTNKDLRERSVEISRLELENVEIHAKHEAMAKSHSALEENYKQASSVRESLMSLLQDLKANLEATRKTSEEQHDLLKTQLEHRERELKSVREMLAEARKDIKLMKSTDSSREWQDKYQETKGELLSLRASSETLETKLASAEKERADLQAKLEAIKTAHETDPSTRDSIAAGEELDRLQERIKERDSQIEQLSERLKETGDIKSRHEEIVKRMNATMDQLDSELERRQLAIKELESKLEQTLLEAQKESQEKESLLEGKTDLERSVGQKTELITELRNEIEQMKRTEEQYQIIEKERKENAEKIAKLEDEIQQLTNELSSSKADVQDATERLKDAKQSWERRKEQLEKSERDVTLRLSESKSLCYNLMEQIKKAAEEGTSQPTSGNQETSSEAIEQFRKVVRDKDLLEINYDEAVRRYERAELELEETRSQLSVTQSRLQELRNADDGHSKERERALNAARNEAAAYKDSNDKLRRDLSELETHRKKLEEEIQIKNAEAEPLAVKVKQLEIELVDAKKVVETLEKNREEWTARSAEIMARNNKIDPAAMEKLEKEAEEMRTKLKPMEEELVKIKDELAASKKELETAKKEGDKNDAEQYEKLKTKYDSVVSRANKIITKYKEEKEEKDTSIKQLNDTIEKKTKEIDEKELIITQLREEIEKKTNDINEKEALLAQLQQQKAKEQNEATAQLEKAIEEQTQTIASLKKKLAEHVQEIALLNQKIKTEKDNFTTSKRKLLLQINALKKGEQVKSAPSPNPAAEKPQNTQNLSESQSGGAAPPVPEASPAPQDAPPPIPQLGEKRVSEIEDPESPNKKTNL